MMKEGIQEGREGEARKEKEDRREGGGGRERWVGGEREKGRRKEQKAEDGDVRRRMRRVEKNQ